jgi:hypothetical protein
MLGPDLFLSRIGTDKAGSMGFIVQIGKLKCTVAIILPKSVRTGKGRAVPGTQTGTFHPQLVFSLAAPASQLPSHA